MKISIQNALELRKFLATSSMSEMETKDKVVAVKIIRALKTTEDAFIDLRHTLFEKIDQNNMKEVYEVKKALQEELAKTVEVELPTFDDTDKALDELFLSNKEMVYSDIERISDVLNNNKE